MFIIIFAFDEIFIRLSSQFPTLLQYPFALALTLYWPYFHSLVGIYISLYLIFRLIKNYDELKRSTYDRLLKIIRTKFIRKEDKTPIMDWIWFLAASLIIAFFADLFFDSVREESIFNFIPGLDVVDNVLTKSTEYPATIKVGEALKFYSFAPVPQLGTLAVFLLRQMHYKQFYQKGNSNYPGSRILLLFLLFVPLLIIINVVSSVFGTLPSDKFLNAPLTFIASTLFNLGFYVTAFFTWILDWYMFSNLWNSSKKLPEA